MITSERPAALPPIIGVSAAVRRAVELIDRFAPTTLPILLVGPTGTGKDLLARHVHARSGRPGRFVAVNCAAIPRDMAESLLFGHRRGAFSGAVETHRGYVECADSGTLFLDELPSLPLDGQAKVLRALDLGEIQPLGAEARRVVDLRIVAAAQDTSGLRRDLFHRVAGVVITLPSLAERPEDVIAIARHFAGGQGQTLPTPAEAKLLGHTWPGNVRELRRVIERAGNLVANGRLPAWAIEEAIMLGGGVLPVEPVLPPDAAARQELIGLLEQAQGDTVAVARRLGVNRRTVYRRMRRLGIRARLASMGAYRHPLAANPRADLSRV